MLEEHRMTTQSMDKPIQAPEWQMASAKYEPELVTSNEFVDSSWLTLLEQAPNNHLNRLLYTFVIKRMLDLILATFLIIVFSPVMLILALLIRWQMGGKVIFSQPRIGLNGKQFRMYKFRSMIDDRRKTQSTYDGEDRRKSHKTRNDPRVTPIGRFIRKTSLDELPQLFNVLRGDMSFVGPRPELLSIVGRYAPWQHQRHLVRPGLTGWWQVQGRSDLPMHEHTELDIYYVVNTSLWLDFRIMLRTVRIVLRSGGAF